MLNKIQMAFFLSSLCGAWPLAASLASFGQANFDENLIQTTDPQEESALGYNAEGMPYSFDQNYQNLNRKYDSQGVNRSFYEFRSY